MMSKPNWGKVNPFSTFHSPKLYIVIINKSIKIMFLFWSEILSLEIDRLAITFDIYFIQKYTLLITKGWMVVNRVNFPHIFWMFFYKRIPEKNEFPRLLCGKQFQDGGKSRKKQTMNFNLRGSYPSHLWKILDLALKATRAILGRKKYCLLILGNYFWTWDNIKLLYLLKSKQITGFQPTLDMSLEQPKQCFCFCFVYFVLFCCGSMHLSREREKMIQNMIFHFHIYTKSL